MWNVDNGSQGAVSPSFSELLEHREPARVAPRMGTSVAFSILAWLGNLACLLSTVLLEGGLFGLLGDALFNTLHFRRRILKAVEFFQENVEKKLFSLEIGYEEINSTSETEAS